MAVGGGESAFDILQLALAPIDLSGINFDDLALSTKENRSRFGAEPVTDKDITNSIEHSIPEKTKQATKWTYSVWCSWCTARDVDPALDKMPVSTVQKHLTHFIMEAKRQDSQPYPPQTLYQLVCGLQRYLRENGRPEVVFFEEQQPEFDKVRKVLDARMKHLTAKGIGTTKKSAQPLTPEQEEKLWDLGIFSIHNAEGLLNAVFWYNCKCFGLRGGDEHNLVREQYAIERMSRG